jgi:hypothetical protein
MDISMMHGFVYIWYDRKHQRYYIGSHWGLENDGYICSSNWMLKSYKKRPEDFKRRIISRIYTNRKDLLNEEQRYLNMIKKSEIISSINTTYDERILNVRYYNLNLKIHDFWHTHENNNKKTIGQKISFSKTGKSVPAPAGRGEAISKAKKGKALTEQHKESLRGIKKPEHTDQWKKENSKRLKEQWSNGTRQSHGPLTEEHKEKIRNKLKGKKLEKDQIDFLKINSSKYYNIIFIDGSVINIQGLKKFGIDNNIPYATLSKSFQNQTSIKKYKIKQISLVSK